MKSRKRPNTRAWLEVSEMCMYTPTSFSSFHHSVPEQCTTCSCEPMDEPGPPPRKIIFASVPRSGNTWMRFLLEQATNISTETVYSETIPQRDTNGTEIGRLHATFSPRTTAYGHECGLIGNCSQLHRSHGRSGQEEGERQTTGLINESKHRKRQLFTHCLMVCFC